MQTTEQALEFAGFKWITIGDEPISPGYWSLKLGETEVIAMPLMFGQMKVQILNGLSCVADIPFKPITKENEL